VLECSTSNEKLKPLRMTTLTLKKSTVSLLQREEALESGTVIRNSDAETNDNTRTSLTAENDNLQHATAQSKLRRTRETLAWLQTTFPLAFFTKDQKPLKIGIQHDIFKHLDDIALVEAADTTILPTLPSRIAIRQALSYYSSNIYYQKSLVNRCKRIDLDGVEVADISDLEQEHATVLYNQKSDLIQKARRSKRKQRRADAKAKNEEASSTTEQLDHVNKSVLPLT
jgi:ProP effector